ncbi:MAG: chromate transporter [Clostridia bacterium]|nr:chromate transporter [Clostridia bacterium]
MKKLKTLLSLFLTMFKIGLFTFGGGYAMIAIIERELVEKKKWIEHEEFMDVVAIAESTPGPLAINSATYIGYKICGFFGSLFATLGVVLPSFIVIYVISLFFNEFLSLMYVEYAFRGIQACVAFLILSAGIKMLKHLKKSVFNLCLVSITVLVMVLFSLFAIDFSTIIYILIGGCIGLTFFVVRHIKERQERKIQNNTTDKEKNYEEDKD